MKRDIENPFPLRNCFLCGEDNPHGLRLRFQQDDDTGEVSTEYAPEARFAGQGDILHGAIQMGLIDEAMGWASRVGTGSMGVTTALDVRFHRPVYLNAGPVLVRCRVVARQGREGRDVRLAGELLNAGGELCTSAEGVYRLLAPERFEALIRG